MRVRIKGKRVTVNRRGEKRGFAERKRERERERERERKRGNAAWLERGEDSAQKPAPPVGPPLANLLSLSLSAGVHRRKLLSGPAR